MDLIYTNTDREDVGVLFDYSFDLAFGSGENDFECTIATKAHCCQAGCFLYIEGTEYGGIIDSIQSKSAAQEVIYSGRSWHGILNSRVIEPDSGQDYFICSGEANAVIGSLITRLGLGDLFSASSENSKLTISNYQMDRYISGYDGIKKMLKKVGGKLIFKVTNEGSVVLSAVPIIDYTQVEEFNSDLVDFEIKKSTNTVNHLICLGQGELAARTVIHLYADKDGNISKTQSQTGLDEYTAVYDYSNVESSEELEKSGIEHLQSLWALNDISIDFDADSDTYDIGDKVGATDNVTGLSASGIITKKIVTIKNGRISINYEVGE